jgi:hypothetical protein
MVVWRVEGYVFLVLAVVFAAEFAARKNRMALGVAVVCLVLGLTGLADSLDRSPIPVLLPISVAGAVVTLWISRQWHRSPDSQQPGEKE